MAGTNNTPHLPRKSYQPHTVDRLRANAADAIMFVRELRTH
jgi:hypothetical protein